MDSLETLYHNSEPLSESDAVQRALLNMERALTERNREEYLSMKDFWMEAVLVFLTSGFGNVLDPAPEDSMALLAKAFRKGCENELEDHFEKWDVLETRVFQVLRSDSDLPVLGCISRVESGKLIYYYCLFCRHGDEYKFVAELNSRHDLDVVPRMEKYCGCRSLAP
jgi:hypothetical protein